MFRTTEDPSSGSRLQRVVHCLEGHFLYSELHTHIGLQYAAITPTTSMSTDTTEPFL